MKVPKARTDWMDVGVTTLIFLIPSAILIAAIAASFAHIKDWAIDHVPDGTHDWQGWAFACIVELIPIFGLLTLWKLQRAKKSDVVARVLIGVGFAFSMAGQVAYAGGFDVGMSRLIVAGLPSIAGLVLTEILLWLVRTILSGDTKDTVIPPPPVLVPTAPQPALVTPAPASVRTPALNVPGHQAEDTDTRPRVSPWTSPPPGRDTTPEIWA